MSAWADRILREFTADLSRFWIALDPDGLLLEERVLHGLRERGFEVLPFEDSVSFRAEYEERFRAAWDAGEDGSAKALVLQLRGADLNALPWDYIRSARQVSLSLADRISQAELRRRPLGLKTEHHEALFQSYQKHTTQLLGEGATKDFILTHIFRLSPYLLNRPEDFWREVFAASLSRNWAPGTSSKARCDGLKRIPPWNIANRGTAHVQGVYGSSGSGCVVSLRCPVWCRDRRQGRRPVGR